MTPTPTRLRMTLLAAVATIACGLSFVQVFNGGGWFWPMVGAAVVASAGCALGRQLRLPRIVVPLIGLASLAVFLTVWHARDVAVLGFWPGPGAIRELNSVSQTAFVEIRKFAVPAPPSAALVFLVATGVGAVAVVVDTLAVTFRSAALAGLGLLALYAVPVAVVKHGVSWVLFVIGAAFWLLLMLAEGRERLSSWGRALGRRSSRGDDVFGPTQAEPLGVLGRRIGVAAVGLAVIVPAILPAIGSGLFSPTGHGTGCCSGTGHAVSSDQVEVNPFVAIASELSSSAKPTTLLTYTTSDTSPDYLRMVTLDTFTSQQQWEPATMSGQNSAQYNFTLPDLVQGAPESTSLTVENLTEQWLPVPYPVTGLTNLVGNWSVDSKTLDVFAGQATNTRGLSYEVTSEHPGFTAVQLESAAPPPANIEAEYIKLPSDIPAQVKTQALQAVAGLTNEFDKAIALQNFFSTANGFSYSSKVPASKSPLVSFLDNKKGFCQQYAGTYAVMARLVGLPTRVDVGFTPGSTSKSGEWIVTNKNAHAWPEVYFSGYGWVRFEPTPGSSTGEVQPPYTQPTTPGPGGGKHTKPLPPSTAAGVNNKDKNLLSHDPRTAPGGPLANSNAQAKPFPWAVAVVLAVLVLILLSPAVARIVVRRRRLRPRTAQTGHDATLGAWDEVADTARDLSWAWSRSRTPRDTATWLARQGIPTSAAEAARRLAGAVGTARYGRPDQAAATDGRAAAADARLVVRGLLRSANLSSRLRATLFPVSVLTPVGAWFADAFDAIDRLGPWLRRSFRGGRLARSLDQSNAGA
jgi:transglutaminase-like putative cysteine protease